MALVINCIADAGERRRFDEVVLPRLLPLAPEGSAIRHLLAPGPLDDGGDHSHLLLSGSELSAASVNERDGELCDLIRAFARAGKPILGICYGHQMVARALGGRCRRAAVPEFGWKRLTIRSNPLFAGVDELVPVHSHYDEVCDLPPSFECIASTDDCAVQAFQVKGRPAWGVQFHPELSYAEGRRMLRSNLETEPDAQRLYVDHLRDPAQVEDHLTLFRNFFATRGRDGSRPRREVVAGA